MWILKSLKRPFNKIFNFETPQTKHRIILCKFRVEENNIIILETLWRPIRDRHVWWETHRRHKNTYLTSFWAQNCNFRTSIFLIRYLNTTLKRVMGCTTANCLTRVLKYLLYTNYPFLFFRDNFLTVENKNSK